MRVRPGVRFEPDRLSVEAAGVLRALLVEGRFAAGRRYPKSGDSSLGGEALVGLGVLRGAENCWNVSTFGDAYRRLLSKREGTLAGLLFDLFWLNRPVATSTFTSLVGGGPLAALQSSTILGTVD